MAESTEEPHIGFKSAGILDTPEVNDDTDQVLVRNTITGRVEQVSKASLAGSGSQNLQQTLDNGNTSETNLIITGANFETEMFEGGFRITHQDTGRITELITTEPLVDGARFLLPAVTTVQDFPLVIAVNQEQPNDGGVVELGINKILDFGAEDENEDGTQLLGLNVESNMYMSTSNVGGGQNYLGTAPPYGVTIYSSSSAFSRGTALFAKQGQLIVQTATPDGTGNFGGFIYDQDRTASMTTDRHIPDIGKVNQLIAASGGGTVTSVTGTTNEIDVANTTTTPVVSLNSTFKNSLVYISGNQTIGGDKTFSNDVQLNPTPVNATSAVTAGYVDNAISGLSFKVSTRVASTANVNLASAPSAIDGVTLANGDRVLLKNQTTASENGIYVFNGTGNALTRSTDGNTGAKLANKTIPVNEGTANQDTWWTITNDSITLGTTAIVLSKTGGMGTYTNGTGLLLSGNIFSADPAYISTATQTALNAKQDAFMGTTPLYVRGDGSLANFIDAVRLVTIGSDNSNGSSLTASSLLRQSIWELNRKISGITSYSAKTAAYTLTATDYTVELTTGSFTFTLPSAVGLDGKEYVLKNGGTGTLTVATTSSQTIDGVTSKTFTMQYEGIRLISNGANWRVIGSF